MTPPRPRSARAPTAVGAAAVSGARPVGPTATRLVLAVLVLLSGLTLLLGYANKARCIGPEFEPNGRSAPDYLLRIDRDVCYSDIQHLWIGRDIDKHVFPYLHGSITPDGQLVGGSVEYPVLTGVLIWAGAIGAETDGGFLLGSALLMAPFGLLTGYLLGRLTRWRALVWALGPPVVLYAFHNWDLPVVACAVAAVFVVHGWRTERSLTDRGAVAAVLLALGFAFKLYPGAFLLPLALYVLTASRPGRLDWWAALRVPVAAGLTVLAVNLPFALAGYQGWLASFSFQSQRKVDLTTNSIWFWGYRPNSSPDNVEFQDTMDWLSPTMVLASFALAAAVGWWRWRRDGVYPWIGVSAAMLCGFLLLHKVHSPQYTLWLLPFFALLRVPWGYVAGYLVVDAVMGIGIFRWFLSLNAGTGIGIYDGLAAQAVAVGVWGRAALLVVLFVVFLRLPDTVTGARAPGADAVAGPAGHPDDQPDDGPDAYPADADGPAGGDPDLDGASAGEPDRDGVSARRTPAVRGAPPE